jgi:4-amino-4-deoxy-L-arabinose transferase-like glycosyltransferase
MFTAFAGIVFGYLAAIAVHILLGLLITREGRGVLTEDSRMSRAYYTQLGLSWVVAAAAGACTGLLFFSKMPGAAITPVAIAALLCFAMIRARTKAPHQQTAGDTLLLMLCVLVGCAIPAYLQLS